MPRFKGLNATYDIQDLEKAADDFVRSETALQEATFDCVIAISKIAMQLRMAIFHDSDQVVRYE